MEILTVEVIYCRRCIIKLNILGTEYDYEITSDKKDTRLCDNNGYCDPYEKKIAIADDYNENAPDSIKNIESFKNKIKRHEIIHSYFAESGLVEYSENEQLVDWIAWHFPKLLATFNEIDAL